LALRHISLVGDTLNFDLQKNEFLPSRASRGFSFVRPLPQDMSIGGLVRSGLPDKFFISNLLRHFRGTGWESGLGKGAVTGRVVTQLGGPSRV
jgi:hypothetical protein